MLKRDLKRLTSEISSRSSQELIFGGRQVESTLGRKTILLIGGKCSGKSSLIDAFANYFYGVKENDNFRYTVFPIQQAAVNGSNIIPTTSVTCYVFQNTKLAYPIAFVDTPSPGSMTPLEAFELIRKWYLSEYYCAVEEMEIWYLIRASDTSIDYDVWQVLNSVVREIECEFIRVLPVVTHATKREPRIALSALARIGYIGLRENEDYYTFNNVSVLNLDVKMQMSRMLSFADNYDHMQCVLKSLERHFRWISITDGPHCTTAVELNLRMDNRKTRFYTTGSFRRSCRAKHGTKREATPKITEVKAREVPHLIMPKMEINVPSRFVKEHDTDKEYEVIRLRRVKVKNFSSQINTEIERPTIKVADFVASVSKQQKTEAVQVIPKKCNRSVQFSNNTRHSSELIDGTSQTTVVDKVLESKDVQTINDNVNEYVQTKAETNDKSSETKPKECLNSYVQTDDIKSAKEKQLSTTATQVTQTGVTEAVETDVISRVDASVQACMDIYFQPIQEVSADKSVEKCNSFCRNSSSTVSIHKLSNHSDRSLFENVSNSSQVKGILDFPSTSHKNDLACLSNNTSDSFRNSNKSSPTVIKSPQEMAGDCEYHDETVNYQENQLFALKSKASQVKELIQDYTCDKKIKLSLEQNHLNDSETHLYPSLKTAISKTERAVPQYFKEISYRHESPEVAFIFSSEQSNHTYHISYKRPAYIQYLEKMQEKKESLKTETGQPCSFTGSKNTGIRHMANKVGSTFVQWEEDNGVSLYEEISTGSENDKSYKTFSTLV